MAIELSNKANIIAPGGSYPYGDIKDDSGAGDGTEVNRLNHADFHQFFARLLALSTITPNNLPDNSANGFQYYEALLDTVNPAFSSTGLVLGGSGITTTNVGSPYYNAGFKLCGNEVKLCGVVNCVAPAPGTIIILTLPVGARPSSSVVVCACSSTGTDTLTIATDGKVSFSAGAPVTKNFYLDGIRFRIS